jgi:hypothetical protein
MKCSIWITSAPSHVHKGQGILTVQKLDFLSNTKVA